MKYTPLKTEDGVKIEAYNTACSQAVTHPSTDAAQCCLTAGIEREPVRSTRYGRRHFTAGTMMIISHLICIHFHKNIKIEHMND